MVREGSKGKRGQRQKGGTKGEKGDTGKERVRESKRGVKESCGTDGNDDLQRHSWRYHGNRTIRKVQYTTISVGTRQPIIEAITSKV